jgi:hypothetical protein
VDHVERRKSESWTRSARPPVPDDGIARSWGANGTDAGARSVPNTAGGDADARPSGAGTRPPPETNG